ncbi:MAG: LamG-like jellyroll fold domain-containing protein [Candidatus Omnitrophota bacterium]
MYRVKFVAFTLLAFYLITVGPAEAFDRVVYYVDGASGNDLNSGTSTDAAWKTINKALAQAIVNQANNTDTRVIIAAGTYRETMRLDASFDPLNFITHTNTIQERRAFYDQYPSISIEANGEVIISGSDVWDGWTGQGNGIYSHPWPYDWGLSADIWAGSPYYISMAPIVRRREMIFVNGSLLTQVLASEELKEETFYIDEENDIAYIRLPQTTDIGTAVIDVSTRNVGFSSDSAINVILNGFTFTHFNSIVEESAVKIQESGNIVIENCKFLWNNWNGLWIGGIRHSTWVGESSDITVKGVIANYNGGSGLCGWRADFVRIEESESSYNAWRAAWGDFYDWAVGQKFMFTRNMTFTRYKTIGNRSCGLWFDSDNKDILVENSELRDNYLSGIIMERSQGPFIIRNCAIRSNERYGVYSTYSRNVTLENNEICDNIGSQIVIAGQEPDGEDNFTPDHETGAFLNLRPEFWTLTNNTIAGEGNYLLEGDMAKGTFWKHFIDTLISGGNYWYNPSTPYLFRGYYQYGVDANGDPVYYEDGRTMDQWQMLAGLGGGLLDRDSFFGLPGYMNPTVTLESPANGLSLRDGAVTFAGSAVSTAELKDIKLHMKSGDEFTEVQAKGVTGLNASVTFAETLPEGEYVWKCSATDILDNNRSSPRPYTLRIDMTAPAIELSQRRSGDSVDITAGAEDPSETSLLIDWNGSLAGWWNFEECSQSGAPDGSAHDNFGQFMGSLGPASTVDAKRGKALRLNGTSDYINAGNGASFNMENEVTVAAWVKQTSIKTDGYRYIVGKGTGFQNEPYVLAATQLGTWRFFTWNGTKQQARETDVILGSWHHVAGVFNGTSVRIYVDGALKGETAFSKQTIAVEGHNLTIGGRDGGGRCFDGSIDDVVVFDRALSSEEIRSLYSAGADKLSRNFAIVTGERYGGAIHAVDAAGNTASLEITVTAARLPMVPADIDGNGKADIVIDFGSLYGIWIAHDDGTWSRLHDLSSLSLAAGDIDGNTKDDIIIDFGPEYGIWVRRDDQGWGFISSVSPESMTTGDITGDGRKELVLDFGPAHGIWVWHNDGTWLQISSVSPESMTTGDITGDGGKELVLDFGPAYGIWAYSCGAWSNISPVSPESMTTGDITGDGGKELVLDFGPAHGIWVWHDGGAWDEISPLNAVSITAGDFNGNDRDDIIIDFGPEYGIWLHYDDGRWDLISDVKSEAMIAGDTDADGKDEIIIDFGTGYGLWVRHGDGSWTRLNDLSP